MQSVRAVLRSDGDGLVMDYSLINVADLQRQTF